MPHLPLALPEEDAHTLQITSEQISARGNVRLSKLPSSNFQPFPTSMSLARWRSSRTSSLHWINTPEALSGAGLIILPGSKRVAADAAWLARTGLVGGGQNARGSWHPDSRGVRRVATARGTGTTTRTVSRTPVKGVVLQVWGFWS